MNAPFSTMGKPEPQIVVFTPAMRTLIADAIESLILLLDEIDGDVDAEDDDPAEENGDAEPSLGATNGINQIKAWKLTIGETDRILFIGLKSSFHCVRCAEFTAS